jgi:hypothetical protein
MLCVQNMQSIFYARKVLKTPAGILGLSAAFDIHNNAAGSGESRFLRVFGNQQQGGMSFSNTLEAVYCRYVVCLNTNRCIAAHC